MPRFKSFNTNWLALGLLILAFSYSAYHVYRTSRQLSTESDAMSGQKIIRVTHWQLEPGFREALDWVIGQYNALPEVQAAGVTVVQAPVPQKVYNQFMNVHLISGTAADIAVKNGTELVQGNALAKFYSPLGSYTEKPNPYNAPQYQSPDLPPELRESLAQLPWRDTFIDGLNSGFDTNLSEYYGIPICATGGMRLFYNLDILRTVKTYTRQIIDRGNDPAWLQKLWLTPDNPRGYLLRDKATEWLVDDVSVPETLGQFMLYCHAVQNYAQDTGDTQLVPIAASNYPHNNITEEYKYGFQSHFWDKLDSSRINTIDGIEIIAGYETGVWSFDSPEIQEYLNLVQDISAFYPTGYLGLDREQAQRRFVLGMAAVMRSGGWDASSILSSIDKRDNPADRFPVSITPAPLPAPDERWAEYLPMRLSEASAGGVAPFGINKQTENFAWALDFLRFATSHRINQEFSKRAGWLPVTIGAKPPASIAAFSPIIEGFPKALTMPFGDAGDSTQLTSIRNAWQQNLKLFASGEEDREHLIDNMTQMLNNPNIGLSRSWSTRRQQITDDARGYNRSIVVERLAALRGDEDAAAREKSAFNQNLSFDEGVYVERLWHTTHPDQPFPDY